MPYRYIASAHVGAANAGATVAATLVGLDNVAAATQPTFDVFNDDGVIKLTCADMADGHEGWVDLSAGGVVLTSIPVSPREVEHADVATSTRSALTAAQAADAVQARFGHAGAVTSAASGGSISAGVSASSLSTTADFYAGQYLVFTSGTLANVARRITAYSAAAGTATFTFSGAAGEPDEPFPATPSAADGFLILGRG